MHCSRAYAVLLLICAMLGCGSTERTASAPARSSARGPAKTVGLPPPGHPLVGKKPPMPAPVDVPSPKGVRVRTYVSGLVIPWDIAFPSKSRMYVTERPGRVRIVENGTLRPKPYAVIRVHARGEGGLLGMTLAPDYQKSRQVYLMYTYSSNGSPHNRVSRFDDTGSTLTNERVVVEGIRGALYHNGGALRFGPDGMLYVGTGDARDPELAQDRTSLNGKILRMTSEGKPPSDNPFRGSLVYAYGLRNVQGLAWNPANGDLWATMHGPTGEFGLHAMDSIFVIKKGDNCGWPRTLGVTDVPGVTPPVLWFPNSSVPPALCTFYRGKVIPGLSGNFFFASLRGEHLARVVLSGDRRIVRLERWFATGTHHGVYGRLRAVVEGPDGALYVSTSNRDGRGTVHPGDDRVLRISAD